MRHWAGDSTNNDATALQKHRAELKGWGKSDEEIDAMIGAEADDEDAADAANNDVFLVWAENWECWQVFSSLTPCFRQDAMSGHYLPLPRPDIESTLRLMQIEATRHRQLFGDLQAMEQEALRILNRGR